MLFSWILILTHFSVFIVLSRARNYRTSLPGSKGCNGKGGRFCLLTLFTSIDPYSKEQSDLGPYCLQYRLPMNISRREKQMSSLDWQTKVP